MRPETVAKGTKSVTLVRIAIDPNALIDCAFVATLLHPYL
jgi:hypothetical protein